MSPLRTLLTLPRARCYGWYCPTTCKHKVGVHPPTRTESALRAPTLLLAPCTPLFTSTCGILLQLIQRLHYHSLTLFTKFVSWALNFFHTPGRSYDEPSDGRAIIKRFAYCLSIQVQWPFSDATFSTGPPLGLPSSRSPHPNLTVEL